VLLAGQDVLLGAEYDFPPSPQPRLRYLVASTPRAGGTYLSMLLWRTGAMGAPLEYLNFWRTMPALIARLKVDRLGAYVERTQELRTSPNGVFGWKAHHEHFQFLELASLQPLLWPAKVLFVERSDRVAQAVSLDIARHTRQWSSLDPAAPAPAYDRERIARALGYIEQANAYWRQILSRYAFPQLSVSYEELVRAPEDTVAKIAAFLAVDTASATPIRLPPIEPQSGPLKGAWRERYRAETA
jgi:LPS sulfotransferase NodH